MERPNRRQWIVLWAGAIWTTGALLIAEDVARPLIGGLVLVGLLFWQLSGATPAKPSPTPGPTQPIAAPSVLDTSEASAAGPSGIGGWLLLPIASQVLTPPTAVWILSSYEGLWGMPVWALSMIAGSAAAGWAAYAGVALLNRWPNAPVIAKTAIVATTLFWNGLHVFASLAGGVAAAQVLPGAVGGVLGSLIWVAYFDKSRRVKATFGPMPIGSIGKPKAQRIAGITAASVLVLSALIATASRPVWGMYSSQYGGFSVLGPGVPSETQDGTQRSVEFETSFVGFNVTADSTVDQFAREVDQLNEIRDRVTANVKGVLTSSQLTQLSGQPSSYAMDFSGTFTVGLENGTFIGRGIVTPTGRFLLLVTGPPSSRTDAQAERFITSFRLAR